VSGRTLPPRPLAVVAALVAALVAGCGDPGTDGYSRATEAVFLESCTAGLGPGGQAVCRCAYDELTRTVPFAEYRRIDRQLRDDPETVPSRISALVTGCTEEVVRPTLPSTTSTTAPPGETTTSTI
jgi:hypothetical protein